MNVLNKLTKKNLLLNKKRTVVTIIGIMLSTALVCAVAGLVTSAQQTFVNLIKNSDGDYHISFSNVPQEQQKYITQNNAVDSYYTTKELGYSEFDSIQNEDKPYIYVVSMNEKAFEKGRKPDRARFEVGRQRQLYGQAAESERKARTGRRRSLNRGVRRRNAAEIKTIKTDGGMVYNRSVVGCFYLWNFFGVKPANPG